MKSDNDNKPKDQFDAMNEMFDIIFKAFEPRVPTNPATKPEQFAEEA